MKLYLLPGMGADQRLFTRIKADGYDLQFIPWGHPDPKDSLADYARKLLPQLPDASDSALLGVSMGGMLAIELGMLTPFRKIVVVSSAKTTKELPPYLRAVARAGGLKYITAARLQKLRRLVAPAMHLMGSEYRISSKMIEATKSELLDWCIHAVLNWDNRQVPANVSHIHGTADLLLPARYIAPGYIPVKGGSHLIIYKRAGEINQLLHKLLP